MKKQTKIQKINKKLQHSGGISLFYDAKTDILLICNIMNQMQDKINELIDKVNELESKLNEKAD